MKKRFLPLLALPFLALFLLAVANCSSGETEPQEATAIIGPGVLEALANESEIEVLIGLAQLDLPLAEQTTELRRQHAAEVQKRVLAVLSVDDFTLIRTFDSSPALHGLLTESGLQMLASHPDVVSIALNCCQYIDPVSRAVP